MPRTHLARPGRPRAHATVPVAAAEQAYRIFIRGLAARTILGVEAYERRKRQDVLIDLELLVATRAGATDRIDDAVDYKSIKDEVLQLVEVSRFHLLEAMAEAVAERCLTFDGVLGVEVTIDKPGALRFARSVAVQARRERR